MNKQFYIMMLVIILEFILILITSYSLLHGLLIFACLFVVVVFFLKKQDPIPIITIVSLCILASIHVARLSYIVISILLVIYILYYFINPIHRNNMKPISSVQVFFYFWVLFATLQLLISPHHQSTWEHYRSLIFGILVIFLITRFVNTLEKLKILYLVWGTCVLATIFVAYWEIFTGNSLLPMTAYPHLNVATVGFFNHNNYSFFLGLSLPIIFYWLRGNFIYQLIALFIITSTYYIVYTNNTRSVLVVLLITSIFPLINTIFVDKKQSVSRLFGIVTLLVVVIFNVDFIKNTIESISTLNFIDDSINLRKQLFLSGFAIFKENPIFGVGPGNSEYYMPNIGDKVHNFWLEILINYGILIFIGLISFFIYFIYVFLKCSSKEVRKMVWPILWSTIIFIPISSTPSSVFNFQILWLYFGLMISGITVIKNNEFQLYNKNRKNNLTVADF